MAGDWAVLLNEVLVNGGELDLSSSAASGLPDTACLTFPPDGLGVPGLRVEDQTYAQKDGTAHFKDWYDSRTITLTNVQIGSDGCAGCPGARQKAKDLMEAWARQCGDVEMVIYTDCHDSDAPSGDRELNGPFGVIGRPRVAELEWQRGPSSRATATLRFDSVDHRLYILDAAGTPGSGQQCTDLAPLHLAPGLYAPAVLATSGLEGYWRLNESTGLVANDSANAGATNGVYDEDTLLGQPPLAPGLGTSAIHLAPVDDPVATGMQTDVAVRSIEMWWRHTQGTPSALWSAGPIATFAALFPSGPVWLNGAVVGNLQASTQAALLDGDAHHVVLTVDGVNARVWVDGVNTDSFASADATIPLNTANPPLQVLEHASDVAVYNTTLSGTQIGDHYALGVASQTFDDLGVAGNVCVPAIVTFTGPLTNPRVGLADGAYVGIAMELTADQTVVVDTATGLATLTAGSTSADVTRFVTGDPFLTVSPNSEAAGQTEDPGDTGTIEICWRPAVVSA